jgi:hypothetical protein
LKQKNQAGFSPPDFVCHVETFADLDDDTLRRTTEAAAELRRRRADPTADVGFCCHFFSPLCVV